MKRTKTERGFAYYEFEDFYGAKCSLQKSSIVEPDCIWLGVKNADPKTLIPGKGWTPYPFPDNVLFTTRMHLSQEQVKKLLPILKKFVKKGEV